MPFLSLAWWASRLGGVLGQTVAITAAIATIALCLAGGVRWIREDARQDERQAAAVRMANARAVQLLILQRREREASAIGSRAERALLQELDATSALLTAAEAKLASRPLRVVCYPKDVVRDLNR